jgi:RNA polymerase sigma factor for flagellar operon FliA
MSTTTMPTTTMGHADLWEAFKSRGSSAARAELLIANRWLVEREASFQSRRLGHHTERADLVGFGTLGLIDAIDRFDPDTGVTFSTFAVYRIRGAMMDGLRAMDWVPRGVRRRDREIAHGRWELTTDLRRTPTGPEVADHLDLTPEALARADGQTARGFLDSLDEAPPDGEHRDEKQPIDAPVGVMADPALIVDARVDRELLHQALGDLSARDRSVITQTYLEGRALREVGAIMGVTESRVCQIRTRALGRLRAGLTALHST